MATPLSRYFTNSKCVFASCIIALLTITYCGVHVDGAAQFSLASQSFSVKSVIKPMYPFSRVVQVTEDYSHDQKRARIQYFSTNHDTGLRTFYYNDNGMIGILYKMDSSSDDSCKKTTVDEFNQEFYKDFDEFGAFMNQISDENAGHIVGPSKLLSVIAARSDQMRRVTDNSTQIIFAGAQNLVLYELNMLQNGAEPGHLVRVYYDASSFSLEPSLEARLPKVIILPSLHVVIRYSSFEMHPQPEPLKLEHQMDTKKIEVDRFAFPVSDKCSGQLPSYDMFFIYSMHTYKVSFSAMSEDATGIEEEHQVEFDGMRQVLRVDKRNYETGQSTSDIFDFRMDRRYMVWQEEAQKDDGRCLMVKNLGYRRSNIQMSDLLVGGGKYSLLGRAKVRGIDALVYSVQALNLPFWYDKPVVYKRDDTDWLRQRGHTVYNIERDYLAGFYSFVYVSDAVEDGVKLLAMEVMQANSIHLLTVHFYDFVWQLSEPANGLHIDQLFTPIEACSAGARDDNYVDVSIMLAQDKELTQQQQPSTWLDDWPSRDAALLASISDSLEIDVTMIHDFESTLVRTNSLYKIDVNFRLSKRPFWLHEFNYVGGATMRPARSYIESSHLLIKKQVQTLRDCLDLINPAANLTYVYYSELESSCVIDPSLTGVEEAELQKFDLFSPKGKPSVGELYQVITRKDMVNFVSTMLRDELAHRLEDRLLLLTNSQADPAMPIDPNIFGMRMKRIKSQNINYLQANGGERQGGPKRGMQPGYALVPTEGGESYIVESKDERRKQLADCQTACAADLNCETFSFCIYFPETECTLSNATYSLIESAITRRITKETREDLGTQSIELRKDFRCEIHQTDHKNYFYRISQPFLMLNTFQIRPANNSEECARICVQETIKQLQEQVQLQHTMHSRSGVGMEQNAEFIDQYKERMRKLCQRFHYLPSQTEKVNRDTVEHYLLPEWKQLSDSHSGGYCLFDKLDDAMGLSKREEEKEKKTPYRYVTFRADLFEFDFSKMYNRQAGFSLLKWEATKEEQDAAISFAHARSEQGAEKLRQFDLEGKNIQYSVHGDEKRCAQLCFYQYAGLCRSFDTYQEQLRSGGRVNRCNLNSQSIRKYEQAGEDVERLKDTSDGIGVNVYHHELKWDLMLKPLARRQTNAATCKTAISLGGFAVFLVAIASLLSGLAFGLKLGQRLSPPRRLLSIPIIVEPTSSQQQQSQIDGASTQAMA